MLMLLMTMSLSSARSIVIAGLFLIPGAVQASAPATDTLAVGSVTDTVHATSDPAQTYALFLPSRYDASRRWPLLVLMDPRGRALIPLKLFQAVAEHYGYIVMSSYQTRSDGPVEPNDKAINALLAAITSPASQEPDDLAGTMPFRFPPMLPASSRSEQDFPSPGSSCGKESAMIPRLHSRFS